MSRVFISYIREDWPKIRSIIDFLRRRDIDVWVDRDMLRPGERWADLVRRGISEGDFFIACFSDKFSERKRSYMNEELTIAIEELRKRKREDPWFIPIKLSRCTIPDWSIGAGETLKSLQWVDLTVDREKGLEQIAETITPNPEPFEHVHYRYQYRILDALGRRTQISLRAHVKVLKKRISEGGTGWSCKPTDLVGRVRRLNESGRAISKASNFEIVGPVKRGLYYIWDDKYSPPLLKNEHISIDYDFEITGQFTKKVNSDSFLAFRRIEAFEWIIEFPKTRPVKKWWVSCDYDRNKQDTEVLHASNRTTARIKWQYGPMTRGAIYYLNWEW